MPLRDLIQPDWRVSSRVRACATTRAGGVSTGPFASFNLATHVDDDPVKVAENRARLKHGLNLPAEPVWLEQVHGATALQADSDRDTKRPCADASFTRHADVVCAVLTADCLPILLCEQSGRAVAALHAGWRGLAAGIIEQGVHDLAEPPSQLLAWLGPAIGPSAFEVGAEVRDAFLAVDPDAAEAFAPSLSGRWLADLYALARQRLRRAGVHRISGGDFCTYSDPARFFSYRRDGRTGRMASLIWLVQD